MALAMVTTMVCSFCYCFFPLVLLSLVQFVYLFTWISSISTNYYFSVNAPYQRGCVGFLLCNPQEIVDIFSLSYTVLINLNLFAFNHCVVYNFYVHSTSQHCSKFYRSFAKFLFFSVCKRLHFKTTISRFSFTPKK